MSNLKELDRAQSGLSRTERFAKYNQFIGALSGLVDEKTWALALNTTYGYIAAVEDQHES